MNFNLKWVVLAVSMAALGGWACGSDSKGGGGSDAGICIEGSASFDKEACTQCIGALMACAMEGKCASETAAADACEEAAYDDCAAEAGGDDDAFDLCIEEACKSEYVASLECFKRDCPAGTACLGFF